jgi:curved DNA-binding protein CbpA
MSPLGDRKDSTGASARGAAMKESVALDEALKAELLDLEAKLETGDAFALIGVPPDSDAATVKSAFYALSRRLHPDHFFRKELGSFRPRLEKVFRALSKAHQTLTDPTRREEYLDAHPQLRKPGTQKRPAPKKPAAREFDPSAPLGDREEPPEPEADLSAAAPVPAPSASAPTAAPGVPPGAPPAARAQRRPAGRMTWKVTDFQIPKADPKASTKK